MQILNTAVIFYFFTETNVLYLFKKHVTFICLLSVQQSLHKFTLNYPFIPYIRCFGYSSVKSENGERITPFLFSVSAAAEMTKADSGTLCIFFNLRKIKWPV